MAKFTMRSKDFGLTYADAQSVTKEELYCELLNLILENENKVVDLMVCEEIGHKTGKRHFHAYIKFEKKATATEETFDLLGLHPHISKVKRQGTRSILPMVKYLTKEDQNPIANFNYLELLQIKEQQENNKRKPDWDSYALEGLTVQEVYERIAMDGFSQMFADHFFNWQGYIKRRFIEAPPIPYISPYTSNDFKLPEMLRMWLFTFNGWIDCTLRLKSLPWTRPNSLVLIGPSRTGKTEWARSLGKHMYFNNLINLDEWNEDADYIVLDDFNKDITKYFPCWKCFFGGQKRFTLTDKYRGKKTVNWGKPMIWLSNEDIFMNLNIEQSNFIKKNCTTVVINEKLY